VFALIKIWRLGAVTLALTVMLCSGSLEAQEQRQEGSKPSWSQGGKGHGGGAHAGAWLRRYHQMPADEQERALNNDSEFKNLPADKQEKLRQRLREFNSYPEKKKQRILRRMELFEHLSPEQQAHARALWDRVRELPDGRRRIVRRTARNLRQFDVAERERVLATAPYQNSFSEQERALIRDLAAFDLEAAANAHRAEEQKP
jgi:Protein of unknown function (DUF3106)